MNALIDGEHLQTKPLQPIGGVNNPEHLPTQQHGRSVRQVSGDRQGKGKNSAAYWQDRIFKHDTRGVLSPHYSMKVAFKGHRMNFTTGTGNKEAAAKIAAGIYSDLLALGVEGTLAKHRPQKAKSDKVATVGEWITAAGGVSEVNPATLNQYAFSLRLIAGGIAALKKNKKRFGPKGGDSTKYRSMIDALSLETLTISALQKWRLSYVAKAKTPAERQSRMTSCNSTIRQARSLFSAAIVFHLKDELLLPSPRPFEIPPELATAKGNPLLFPKQNARYLSKIDPKELLRKANEELATKEPAAFLAMLLALGASLRRGEIDGLKWNQIDFKKGIIRVEVTESASLKTQDSQGEVDIDEQLAALLQGFKAKAKAKDADFVIEGVIEGEMRGPRSWGQHYRANAAFDKLNAWLRAHGVEARKPIHELRKELGALITQEHGIYAASRALRHSNVATTAAHYADKKDRSTVAVGSWLTPENVIEMPETAQEPKEPKQEAFNSRI